MFRDKNALVSQTEALVPQKAGLVSQKEAHVKLNECLLLSCRDCRAQCRVGYVSL